VIERHGIPVTLTANQNILLRDIEPAWREEIQATLEVRGLGGFGLLVGWR
jgi:sulfite reductase beta subunit-like hemoprotein